MFDVGRCSFGSLMSHRGAYNKKSNHWKQTAACSVYLLIAHEIAQVPSVRTFNSGTVETAIAPQIVAILCRVTTLSYLRKVKRSRVISKAGFLPVEFAGHNIF